MSCSELDHDETSLLKLLDTYNKIRVKLEDLQEKKYPITDQRSYAGLASRRYSSMRIFVGKYAFFRWRDT